MIKDERRLRSARQWVLMLTLILPGMAGAQPVDAYTLRLEALLLGTPSHYGCLAAPEDRGALQRLYATNTAGGAAVTLWPPSGAATAQLLQALQQAADAGLVPSDYCAAALAQASQTANADSAAQADWDYTLSAMALKFMRELHQGRIEPRLAGFDLQRPRTAPDYVANLQQIAAGVDARQALTAMEPRYVHYQLLKTMLARYRRLAAGDWAALPGFSARSIKPGETYEGAPALRQRLALLGDSPGDLQGDSPSELPADPASSVPAPSPAASLALDPALSAALASFQQRHGLQPDGVLGRRTLATLNVPPAYRVRQIELSLERWRWLPEVSTRAIVVNIPQFRLFAFTSAEDRELGMLDMPVVVGQDYEDKRTPVFAGQLQYVVFKPYWDVPYSISHREILPAQARDPGYLSKHHFELVDGQSDNSPVVAPTPENLMRVESGKVRIRQLPGEDNALGNIKFLLPNPYNVYLHSTPAKALFAQARRAFSHGCIRVSDPAALAAYVLRDAPGDWSAEHIAAAMGGEPNQRITLTTPIPVMILYTTAVATESGRAYFLDDLYGHDRKLERLLKLAPVADAPH